MSDVKWIKIVTDIFDDEKMLLIEALPDSDSVIVIWFKLLCLAGKQNNHGVFMLNDRIPYTEEMLATIMRRPINTIRLALSTFESFGMIERFDNVITIPNWEKHQSLDALEAKKERDRMYQSRKRAEQKLLTTNNRPMSDDVSDDNRSTEEDKNKNKKRLDNKYIESEFEKFWQVYPKKKSKSFALKAFSKIADKVSVDTLIKAVDAQKHTAQWQKDDGQYIPFPATWLNQQRWEDEDDSVAESQPNVGLPISVAR